MMQCPSCNRDNPAKGRFCGFCGGKLALLCKSCGASNPHDSKFCGACGQGLTPVPAAPAPANVSLQDAQRRHLTVMFCDIVGSTEMSTRMDPEDLRDLIRGFEADAERIIARHDGFIARYMGDGILVYYGYPQAREDDAERAVRCSLELINSLENNNFTIRIGIATGEVVVGDLIGSGTAKEHSVVGQTPNLAARLQALAPPQGIIISPSTKSLVGGLFDYSNSGKQSIKGFTELIEIWQVIGERKGASRFESNRSKRTPFVGREKEIRQLLELGTLTTQGHGQIVAIQGEAGMGKSRLAYEFQQRFVSQANGLMRLNCAPHFQNTALYPISSRIEFEAGFNSTDSADVKMGKLEVMLENSPGPQSLSYVAALVSILFRATDGGATENPAQQKEQTLKALENHVLATAAEQPLLILMEDMHWCDPTSLELLDRLAALISNVPVMILTTSRPEFIPNWDQQEHATLIELERINSKSCSDMIRHLAEHYDLSANLYEQILAKSDRVPLYLEELTKGIVESGATTSVPNNLQDILMERLDRLAEVKGLAQLGSVIGREFSIELIASVADIEAEPLQRALDKLVDAQVLQSYQSGDVQTYGFRHALLADAAYEGLLNKRRRELHSRIAQSLNTEFAESVARQPEVLARHLTAAKEFGSAIPVWQRAGERANQLAAYREAIDHFGTALELVPNLQQESQRTLIELEIQGQLGTALSRTLGYAAPGVKTAFLRELELAETLGNNEKFAALRRVGTFYIVRAEYQQARTLLIESVAIADEEENPAYQIDAYNGLGYIQGYCGELDAGRHSMETALDYYYHHNGNALTYVTEQDAAMSAEAFLCLVTWISGDLDGALRYKARLMAFADQSDSAFDQAYALAYATAFELLRENHTATIEYATRGIKIASEHGIILWEYLLQIYNAASQQATGVIKDATPTITAYTAGYEATGARSFVPILLCLLSRSHAQLGRMKEAEEAIDSAIACALNQKEIFIHSYLLQQKAAVAELVGDRPSSIVLLEEALDIAQAQRAKTFALTAATKLAELDDGRHRLAILSTIAQDYPTNQQPVPELGAALHVLNSAK